MPSRYCAHSTPEERGERPKGNDNYHSYYDPFPSTAAAAREAAERDLNGAPEHGRTEAAQRLRVAKRREEISRERDHKKRREAILRLEGGATEEDSVTSEQGGHPKFGVMTNEGFREILLTRREAKALLEMFPNIPEMMEE